MKRTAALLALAAVILAVCVFDTVFVPRVADRVCRRLDRVPAAVEAGDPAAARQAADEAVSAWRQAEWGLMICVDRQVLDQAENQLLYVQALATQKAADLVPAAVLCKAYVWEMPQQESVSFASWF